MRLTGSGSFIFCLALFAGMTLAGCATPGAPQGAKPPVPAAVAPGEPGGEPPVKAAPVLTPATKNPKAPEVVFFEVSGREIPLSSLAGQAVVLVNFWGVRCQNCIEEMPFLERLFHKYGGKGLTIIGVNTDGLDSATLAKYLPNLPKVSYPIVVDPDFKVNDAFQMSAAPLNVVVAKDGTIRYRHEGYEPAIEQEYLDLIDKLLAE